jgi:hypothetical protein
MSPFAIKALRDKQRSRDFYPGGRVIDGLFPAADFAIDTCADETPGDRGAGNTPTHNLASFTQIPGHIDDHDAVRPLR